MNQKILSHKAIGSLFFRLVMGILFTVPLSSCDNNTNPFDLTPPPRTRSNFNLLNPVDSAIIVIPDSVSAFGARWSVPVDVIGQLRYTFILDRDEFFENGTVLSYDTFQDTITLSRDFLLALPLAPADTSLFCTVLVSTTTDLNLRSNITNRIKLIVR